MPKAKSLAIVALIVVFAGACYGYYPPTTSALPGREAKLMLTDSGSVVLSSRIGREIDAIEGTVVADTAALYDMAISTTVRRDGQEFDWQGERVMVPHVFVSKVEERRFSLARTSLFTAATIVALIATKAAFSGATGANVPGGTPGHPGGGQ